MKSWGLRSNFLSRYRWCKEWCCWYLMNRRIREPYPPAADGVREHWRGYNPVSRLLD